MFSSGLPQTLYPHGQEYLDLELYGPAVFPGFPARIRFLRFPSLLFSPLERLYRLMLTTDYAKYRDDDRPLS